jgi:5-methylcytosine-specific restriction protein B
VEKENKEEESKNNKWGKLDVTKNIEIDPIFTLIQNYKSYIETTKMKDEAYKWEFISKYKGKPDIDASDFASEYKSIKFGNLMYQLASAVGNHICKEHPEEFRRLFVDLFDESVPLNRRVNNFNVETLTLYRSMGEKLGHHQDERSIATYLTLHNPEKYTFYKSGFYKGFCKLLGVAPAGKNEKYGHYLELLNQFIEDYIVPDTSLVDAVKSYIPEYYDGSNNLTLAQDILYCMLNKNEDDSLRNHSEKNEINVKYWLYAPGENASMWDEFLRNGVMGLGWDELGNLADYASKEEVAIRLQELSNSDSSKANDATANFDFKESISIGDVIIAKKGRNAYLGYGIVTSDYFYDDSTAIYKSKRKVNWVKHGYWESGFTIVLKTLTDITNLPYKPNPSILAPKAILDLINGQTRNSMNQKPINQILYGPPGTGKTYKLKDQYFPKYTTKETSITSDQHFKNVVSECSWWQVIAIALIKLGKSKVSDIANHQWVIQKAELSNSKTVRPTIWGQLQSHTVDDCQFVNVKSKQQPFIFNKTEDSFWEIVEDEIKEKVPELYEIIDSVDNFNPSSEKIIERFVFTTFHQSYSYEDFIEGIKPVMSDVELDDNVAYKIEDGIFKQLCKKAEMDPENRYAIFIDEINRGNVSAIFGELITLIEQDKRKGATNPMSVMLPYSKKQFSVPNNVDIYGTMNTADRSVEALDTALRRRFSFEEMLPKPQLLREKGENGSGKVGEIDLVELLITINDRIEALVDRDHTIGHAFFMEVDSLDSLRNVFANKVIPLLQEYFYGDYAKMEMVIGPNFFNSDKRKKKVLFAVQNEDVEIPTGSYELINVMDQDFDFESALERLFSTN